MNNENNTRASELLLTNGDEKSLSVKLGKTENVFELIDMSNVGSMVVSGTVGSGKSNFVKSIILGLFMNYGPECCSVAICDQKMVDYQDLNKNAKYAYIFNDQYELRLLLNAAVDTLNSRQKYLQKERNISFENIYIIIDDYNYYASDPKIYEPIEKIILEGKDVQIHCILVTTDPSSLLSKPQNNISIANRITFHTTTRRLSNIVINSEDAVYLDYPGQFIYRSYEKEATLYSYNATEVALPFFKNTEKRWIDHITKPIPSDYLYSKTHTIIDPYLYEECKSYIIKEQRASTVLLQRKFNIGYNTAALIIDKLEEDGIIGPQKGGVPREIYIQPRNQQDNSDEVVAEQTSIANNEKLKKFMGKVKVILSEIKEKGFKWYIYVILIALIILLIFS